MSKKSNLTASTATVAAAPSAPKEVKFAFNYQGPGHYTSSRDGYEIKQLESGGWRLTQKVGQKVTEIAIPEKDGKPGNIYAAIRTGKEHAGVEFTLPEKTVLKAAMAAKKAAAPAPVVEEAATEAEISL